MPAEASQQPAENKAVALLDLFGNDVHASVHVRVDSAGDVEWYSDEQTKEAIEKLLKPVSQIWSDEHWRQAMGLEEVPWHKRVLLLCRAQVKARTIAGPANTREKFIGLPDGQAISTRLFWPPGQPTDVSKPFNNPLTRVPEAVTLWALQQILEEEKKAGTNWNDATLGEKLTEWFRTHGADDTWLFGVAGSIPNENPITSGHVNGFRDKLKDEEVKDKDLGHLLPTKTERARSNLQ